MAEHIEDDAAALLRPIIPGRALGRLQVALEDPIAELAPHREHASEEAGIAQHLQFQETGQEELVLHDAVLDAAFFGEPRDGKRVGKVGRARLLAIDMLAGLDRLADHGRPHLRGARVEEDLVRRIGERGRKVGRPALDVVPLRQRFELVAVPADEDRVGNDPVAVFERDPAFVADRQDGADEVLVGAHPPGHAVHDDSEAPGSHSAKFLHVLAAR